MAFIRRKMRATACLLALAIGVASSSSAQPLDEPATTQSDPEEGPLTATITAFRGLVRVRAAQDQPWSTPAIGMVLPEGAEFSTAPRASIQFIIPPGQTVTLDRLGVIKLVRSNFANGKVNTQLGMKYGRTRFTIESAGREYEASVTTPSSVLSVRGTDLIAFDQPPFAPEGVSIEGRVMFRDVRKQVSVGGKKAGRARVTAERDTTAQTALADSNQSSRGRVARTMEDDEFVLTSTNPLAHPDLNIGLTQIASSAQSQATFAALLPRGLASFELFYTGMPGTNVDLVVRTPLGETIDVNNRSSRSGGVYLIDLQPTDKNPTGFDQIAWTKTAPAGVYTVQQILKSGVTADTTMTIYADKLAARSAVLGPVQTQLRRDQQMTNLNVDLNPSSHSTGTVIFNMPAGKAAKKR